MPPPMLIPSSGSTVKSPKKKNLNLFYDARIYNQRSDVPSSYRCKRRDQDNCKATATIVGSKITFNGEHTCTIQDADQFMQNLLVENELVVKNFREDIKNLKDDNERVVRSLKEENVRLNDRIALLEHAIQAKGINLPNTMPMPVIEAPSQQHGIQHSQNIGPIGSSAIGTSSVAIGTSSHQQLPRLEAQLGGPTSIKKARYDATVATHVPSAAEIQPTATMQQFIQPQLMEQIGIGTSSQQKFLPETQTSIAYEFGTPSEQQQGEELDSLSPSVPTIYWHCSGCARFNERMDMHCIFCRQLQPTTSNPDPKSGGN